MSRQEWDSLPWWEAELLLEGLEKEAREAEKPANDGNQPGTPSPPPDLTSTDLDPVGGFTFRSAG